MLRFPGTLLGDLHDGARWPCEPAGLGLHTRRRHGDLIDASSKAMCKCDEHLRAAIEVRLVCSSFDKQFV